MIIKKLGVNKKLLKLKFAILVIIISACIPTYAGI